MQKSKVPKTRNRTELFTPAQESGESLFLQSQTQQSQTASLNVLSPEPIHPEIHSWLDMEMRNSTLPLDVHFHFWQGQSISFPATQDVGCRQVEFIVNHPGVIGELLKAGTVLHAIDLIIDGHLDFVGTLDDVIAVFCHLYGKPFKRSKSLEDWCNLLPSIAAPTSAAPGWHHLPENSPARDKAVVQHHYDVSNDFYKLWLDPQMLYSCAHFETEEMNLAQAQEAKLDLICRKLDLKPGESFLDIGCGWGALLKWAATKYGVKAHGITLSLEQLDFNQRWIADCGLESQITVELEDYRDLPEVGTYDKISSIGMMEHVGIANYPKYFKNAHACLNPGGLFLNHGIALNQIWMPEVAFILRYIFPDAHCPQLTTYLQFATECGWEIVDVDSWRPHYVKTLRAWADNLDAQLAPARAIVGNRVKMWQLYLRFCAQGFENGSSGIYQTLLRRSADSQWDLPLTRKGWLC